jgi:hypothetical protein
MTTGLGRSRSSKLERTMFASGTGDAGTLFRSTWNVKGGGPVGAIPAPAPMVFPTLDTNNAHLQLTAPANSSFVMVSNDDATKCIVIDHFEATWNNPAGAQNPRALFGTLAEEDSTDDLIVWMCSYISGFFATNSPIKLSPGKDLIHYNVKGPGQRNATMPAFFKLYYHFVQA